jgi:hypothetical protein
MVWRAVPRSYIFSSHALPKPIQCNKFALDFFVPEEKRQHWSRKPIMQMQPEAGHDLF